MRWVIKWVISNFLDSVKLDNIINFNLSQFKFKSCWNENLDSVKLRFIWKYVLCAHRLSERRTIEEKKEKVEKTKFESRFLSRFIFFCNSFQRDQLVKPSRIFMSLMMLYWRDWKKYDSKISNVSHIILLLALEI